MPYAWTTAPFTSYYLRIHRFIASRFPLWGLTGISAALVFYLVVSGIVVLIGRFSWQEAGNVQRYAFSTFLLLKFLPRFSLIGKKKKVQPEQSGF
jgi:hypothetical protein